MSLTVFNVNACFRDYECKCGWPLFRLTLVFSPSEGSKLHAQKEECKEAQESLTAAAATGHAPVFTIPHSHSHYYTPHGGGGVRGVHPCVRHEEVVVMEEEVELDDDDDVHWH